MFKRLIFASWAAAIICALSAPMAAQAQPVVRIVVGGPPGGLFDNVLRVIMEPLQRELASTVVIDNKPGAGGAVALASVRAAKPDGLTVAMINVSAAANETLIANRGYTLLGDFDPVGMYAHPTNILIVNPALAANDLRAFVELVKTRPSPVNYASGGVGSPGHLSGEMFRLQTGAPLTHVPYRGAPPAVLAVVTGEVGFMFSTASAAIGQIEAGKVRALAVTTQERLPRFPDLPTMAQAGLADFKVGDWFGFMLPKGTPAPVRDKLHSALQAAMGEPQVRERLAKASFLPATKMLGPAEFGAFLQAEIDKWNKVIRQAGMVPQ